MFRSHGAWKIYFHSFFMCWVLSSSLGMHSCFPTNDSTGVPYFPPLPFCLSFLNLLFNNMGIWGQVLSLLAPPLLSLSLFETFPTVLPLPSSYIHFINLQTYVFIDFLWYCNFLLLGTPTAHLLASTMAPGQFYFAQVANHRLDCNASWAESISHPVLYPFRHPAWCHEHSRCLQNECELTTY